MNGEQLTLGGITAVLATLVVLGGLQYGVARYAVAEGVDKHTNAPHPAAVELVNKASAEMGRELTSIKVDLAETRKDVDYIKKQTEQAAAERRRMLDLLEQLRSRPE